MGIATFPGVSDSGKPLGATDLVFGGYSSLGAYTYASVLPAGTYAVHVRYATSTLTISTDIYPYIPKDYPSFNISGVTGNSYAPTVYGQGVLQQSNNSSYGLFQTRVSDGVQYIIIPSTETALSISAGYVSKIGTTVAAWTVTSNPASIIKPDITALDQSGSNVYIGTAAPYGFSNKYFIPQMLSSTDAGTTFSSIEPSTQYSWGKRNSYQSVTYATFGSESISISTSTMAKLSYLGGKYYQYGNNGINDFRLSMSTDLSSWNVVPGPFGSGSTGQHIKQIAYSPTLNRYVAAFYQAPTSGNFVTSADGITWFGTANTKTMASPPQGVVYGNGVFVGVTFTSADTVTSADGITWTTRTSGQANLGQGVYGTRFVFPSNNQSLVAHTTDGVTWATAATSLTASSATIVAYGAKYVLGTGVGQIATSTDGITWTSTGQLNGFGTTAIQGIAYGNSTYVAVGASGQVRSSTDALTWTTRSIGTPQSLLGLTYGSKGFFTSDEQSTVFGSTDGITWASSPAYNSQVFSTMSQIPRKDYSVIYSSLNQTTTGSPGFLSCSSWNGLYNFAGSWSTTGNIFNKGSSNSPGKIVAAIPNPSGINYPTLLLGNTNDIYITSQLAYYYQPVGYFSGAGFAVLSDANFMYTPTCAIYSYPAAKVVVGGESGKLSYKTGDLATSGYTQVTSTFGVTSIRAITYGGGIFLAAGDSGQLRTSTDAVTWTTRTSGFGTSTIKVLSWTGSVYIAAGGGGYLTSSTDGVTWTARTANMGTNDINVITPSPNIRSSSYASTSTFCIGGNNGAFAQSLDGITWTTRDINFDVFAISDIKYDGSKYIAIGGYNSKMLSQYFSTPQNVLPPYTYSQAAISAGPVFGFTSTDGLTWSKFSPYVDGQNLSYSGFDPKISSIPGVGYFIHQNYGLSNNESDGVNINAVGIFSTDLITWSTVPITPLYNSTNNGLSTARQVSVANSRFFASSPYDSLRSGTSTSAMLAQSTNGITWTSVANTPTYSVKDITYLNSLYFLFTFGTSEVGRFYTSPDLVVWTARSFGSSNNASAAIYDSLTSKYIVIDENGYVYTSPNLTTWTQQSYLGYTSPKKITAHADSGKFLVQVGGLEGINFTTSPFLNTVILYGSPTTGWMPTVSSPITEYRKNSIGGFAYNSTTNKLVSNLGFLELQSGTMGTGTTSFGTTVPSYISLYKTDQITLN